MSKTVSYAQWSLEPYSIGMKLRTLRTQKRLTLSRLAAETGFRRRCFRNSRRTG
jgi:hypothetical protein